MRISRHSCSASALLFVMCSASQTLAEDSPGEVWLHVDAPKGVLLQREKNNYGDLETVCEAPCDQQVPTAFYYRLTGSGIKSSDDFTLHGAPGTRVKLVVDGAPKAAFVVGIVGIVGGAVALPVGVFMWFFEALHDYAYQGTSTTGGGEATMAIGSLALCGGLVLALSAAITSALRSSPVALSSATCSGS
jgi:hypothetical protein